ncbi:MAG: signal recognition particle-docking protein FtsY [Candidatus Aureabacteria bacterium]|nr:signal recognition particle-docking protein FtsY [Candidatus Auribacterota bacterium]
MITGILSRMKKAMRKSRLNVSVLIKTLLRQGIPEKEMLEEIERLLLQADVGPVICESVSLDLMKEAKSFTGEDSVKKKLKELLLAHFRVNDGIRNLTMPQGCASVIMFVGVNGSGKTSSIAKIANYLLKDGRTVMIAGCDTFRAAAAEQLEFWSEKLDIPLIKGFSGADPASVAFDACKSAAAKGCDFLLIDTAGRQHTKNHLMEEMKKIKSAVTKCGVARLSEILLVLDAVTGQNGIVQAAKFNEALCLTGVVLSKMDGTAKGGITLRIEKEERLPVKFISFGESLDDLSRFNPADFVESLLMD